MATRVRIRIRGIGRGVMIRLRRVEMGMRRGLVRGERRVVGELEGHLIRGEVLRANSMLSKAPSILYVLWRAELERSVDRGGIRCGRDERIVGGDGRGKVVHHHGHHNLVLGEHGRVGGRVPERHMAAMSIHVLWVPVGSRKANVHRFGHHACHAALPPRFRLELRVGTWVGCRAGLVHQDRIGRSARLKVCPAASRGLARAPGCILERLAS